MKRVKFGRRRGKLSLTLEAKKGRTTSYLCIHTNNSAVPLTVLRSDVSLEMKDARQLAGQGRVRGELQPRLSSLWEFERLLTEYLGLGSDSSSPEASKETLDDNPLICEEIVHLHHRGRLVFTVDPVTHLVLNMNIDEANTDAPTEQ